ncbi:response regulator transcription factor, partial [Nocardia sp. NPDC004722]
LLLRANLAENDGMVYRSIKDAETAMTLTGTGSPELTTALLRRTRAHPDRRVPETLADAIATLSPRELDVARLVAEGATNAEVGARLHLSLGTVKTHIASIQRRLDARNRVEIAARAWQSGLMD